MMFPQYGDTLQHLVYIYSSLNCQYMRTLCCILAASLLTLSCSTPMPAITARPDPNVMTTGTVGSVNATNGPTAQARADKMARDSAVHRSDSTIH